jgi:hypothetical protein
MPHFLRICFTVRFGTNKKKIVKIIIKISNSKIKNSQQKEENLKS